MHNWMDGEGLRCYSSNSNSSNSSRNNSSNSIVTISSTIVIVRMLQCQSGRFEIVIVIVKKTKPARGRFTGS